MDRWREREKPTFSCNSLPLLPSSREQTKYKKKKRGGEGRKEAGTRRTAEPRENGGGRVTANTRPQNRQAKRISLSVSLSVQDGRTYGGPQWWLLFSLARFKGESDMCSIFRHWPVFVSLSDGFSRSPLSPSSSHQALLFLTGVFSSTPL